MLLDSVGGCNLEPVCQGVAPRTRDSKLSRRFGTVRFVYRSRMGRERSEENGTASPGKCMRTLSKITRTRRGLSLSLFLFISPTVFRPPLSFSLALTCWCGLELRLRVEVNSRVHLCSTRWIIQRYLALLSRATWKHRTRFENWRRADTTRWLLHFWIFLKIRHFSFFKRVTKLWNFYALAKGTDSFLHQAKGHTSF